MKKIIAVGLAVLLGALMGLTAWADGLPEDDYSGEDALAAMLDEKTVTAPYAILTEPDSGCVIFEKNADTPTAPASITKVMSLLLIMEAIERGELALEDKVTCSEHAASMGGSQIWLEPGETMSVNDLLKAVAVGSANDATVALAEHLCGSEDTFVALMNKRAVELGMKNTSFMNCSGLDEENHYTTARDTAIVSGELIGHELIVKYSTIWMDSLRGGETGLVNTNRLVRFYDGITGLKTGTTDDAGCCLSATAERGGLKLVAVVFGAANSNERFSSARLLLDYGFANYTIYTPPSAGELSLPVERGTSAKLSVTDGEITPILVEKIAAKGITQRTVLPEKLTAPIQKGQSVGRVEVMNAQGESIGGYTLVAAEDIPRLDWGRAFVALLESIMGLK